MASVFLLKMLCLNIFWLRDISVVRMLLRSFFIGPLLILKIHSIVPYLILTSWEKKNDKNWQYFHKYCAYYVKLKNDDRQNHSEKNVITIVFMHPIRNKTQQK